MFMKNQPVGSFFKKIVNPLRSGEKELDILAKTSDDDKRLS